MKRWLLLLLFIACGAIASAQGAELPDGLYRDLDPAASYIRFPPGMRSHLRTRLNAALQKNPRNSTALVHRAYLFMEAGDIERAKRDYDRALEVAEPGSEYERNVLWSRGWAEYELDEYAATLRDWQKAAALHGGRPYWVGYSYALLYWTLGERDAALQWFEATVASFPEWGTEIGFNERIKYWSPAQKERMRALFKAWLERDPPTGSDVAPGYP